MKGDESCMVDHRFNSVMVLYKAQSKALAVVVTPVFMPTGFQADTKQTG